MELTNYLRKSVDVVAQKMGYVTKADFKAIALSQRNNIFGSIGGATQPLLNKGLMKPSNLSFAALRKLAKYDALIRICINIIKKSVSQSEWAIVPKKGVDNPNEDNIKYVEDLFTLQNKNNENMRLLLDRVLEDLLVLDACCIEKIKDPMGRLVGLNSVDGATIRPVYNEYGELGEVAYVQVIDGKVMAEFKNNELIYIMQNPQNDIYSFGYGLSPIESILLQVNSALQADLHNARTFSEDNVPPGILDLGDMPKEEAEKFIQLWNATVPGKTQRMKFVWGSNSPKKYMPFKVTNKDMQFVEYTDWLSRIKLATYGLSTLDANITQDINRSTAREQREISNSRGVQNVKQLIEEYFNREIIMELGFDDIQFKFDETTTLSDKKTLAEIDKINVEIGTRDVNELRQRDGLNPYDFEEDVAPAPPKKPKEEETPPEDDIEGGKKASNNQYVNHLGYYPPLYD